MCPSMSSFRSISCPILVLCGESSDVLPTSMAWAMQRSNRNANVTVLPRCGHAPALNTPSQIKTVLDFLDSWKEK